MLAYHGAGCGQLWIELYSVFLGERSGAYSPPSTLRNDCRFFPYRDIPLCILFKSIAKSMLNLLFKSI